MLSDYITNFIYKLKNYKPLFLKFGISSLDEAIRSVTRFLTAYFLIKTMTKVDYGYYSLIIPITLLILSIQNAIINSPLMVLYVERNKVTQASYVSSLIIAQIFFSLIIFLFTIVIAVTLLLMQIITSAELFMFISVAIAVAGLLSWEFLRGIYFTKELPQAVIKIDIVYFFILCILTLFIYSVFFVNVAIIFILIGISSLSVSFMQNKSLVEHIDLASIKMYLRENWVLGKWALGGVIVTHIQTYGYIYMIGLLISAEAIAEVSAARLLLMPFAFLVQGWGKIAVPRGARLREDNKVKELYKEQIVISILLGILIVIYTTLIISIPENLKDTILSHNYANSYNYVIFIGISLSFKFFSMNAMFGHQALKNFSIITKVNFITMIVVILSSYILINLIGVEGALLASILGQFLLATGLWITFSKSKNEFINN